MKEGYIYVDNSVFATLLALSEKEQEQGLMYISPPVPNMTFIYKHSKVNYFWMKNTKAPLDIVFCNNNKVSQICYGEPFSTQIIGNNSVSDLVIEFPHGTINSSNIKIGHSVGLVSLSLDEIKNYLKL